MKKISFGLFPRTGSHLITKILASSSIKNPYEMDHSNLLWKNDNPVTIARDPKDNIVSYLTNSLMCHDEEYEISKLRFVSNAYFDFFIEHRKFPNLIIGDFNLLSSSPDLFINTLSNIMGIGEQKVYDIEFIMKMNNSNEVIVDRSGYKWAPTVTGTDLYKRMMDDIHQIDLSKQYDLYNEMIQISDSLGLKQAMV